MINTQEKPIPTASVSPVSLTTRENRLVEQIRQPRLFNDYGEEIFLPGTWVQAGIYRQVDTTKVVIMREDGILPPSFDGRRAEYCRIERPWVTGPLAAEESAG
jgi:hypothetical protein